MADLERDFVELEDDNGNKFELDVIDYFEHEGQEYAILMDLASLEELDESDAEPTEQEVYILKVVADGEYEEFLPPDEDKMDALIAIAEELLSDDCDCGCDDDHDHDCGCGCGDHAE